MTSYDVALIMALTVPRGGDSAVAVDAAGGGDDVPQGGQGVLCAHRSAGAPAHGVAGGMRFAYIRAPCSQLGSGALTGLYRPAYPDSFFRNTQWG